jgi:surfeit locus 1 family protein
MKKRFPIISTIIVAGAVATMIALGIWQLQRKGEKEALLAVYASNIGKPAMALPMTGPVPDEAMFRKASANCLEVIKWRTGSARDAKGQAGVSYIAECRTGAEGPGFLASMGVAAQPNLKPEWTGGIVSGMIVTEPSHSSILMKAFGSAPVLGPMLVSETPPAGMRAVARPDPDDVPNNHMAYAVQWFLFAGAAAVIYLLALRKRQAEV